MDITLYVQATAALLVILGVFLLGAYGLRRFGLVPGMVGPGGGKRAKRLNIEEILVLDARRRLVLVRHDGREHLLMLGLENDLVVYSGTIPPSGPITASALEDRP